MSNLKIIVPENFKEFGLKVDKHLMEIRKTEESFIVPIDLIRFNNGEGKGVIKDSIRDKDLYILSDVSNYDISYKLYNRIHYMSPDEHFQDIKRILSAECGHASKRTLIMPYLYQSRQDKKDSRESLDCAIALSELVNLGVDEIVTCDVHNKSIMNSVPKTAFENMYLTDTIILDWLVKENISNLSDIICISPDEGAMKRARFFSEVLGNVEIGSFYKQRDYSIVVNGKNPIIEHKFLGPKDLTNKVAIVVDDMIASGGSILDTAMQLKKLGAEKIYLMVTFALFTNGTDKFDEYYNNGFFDKVYATNLSYIPNEIKDKNWFESVDCSYNIANLINNINYGRSIGEIIQGKSEVVTRVRDIRKERIKK